jgi:hypothetical protein
MADVLQLAGALAILAAFIGVQLGKTSPSSYFSLLLNLGGSALLAYLALEERQWGFLLLEAVWAIVSAWSLIARVSGRLEPLD